jgi:hypothetical protein
MSAPFAGLPRNHYRAITETPRAAAGVLDLTPRQT